MTEHERNLTNQVDEDPLYEQAVDLVREAPEFACISRIQRKLLIGYNRASRIMNRMIERGVIVRTSSVDEGVSYKVLPSATQDAATAPLLKRIAELERESDTFENNCLADCESIAALKERIAELEAKLVMAKDEFHGIKAVAGNPESVWHKAKDAIAGLEGQTYCQSCGDIATRHMPEEATGFPGPYCDNCPSDQKIKPAQQVPLTDEQIDTAIAELGLDYLAKVAGNRSVLRELCRRAAHGITGDKP